MSKGFKAAMQARGTEKLASAVQQNAHSPYPIGQPLPTTTVDNDMPADGRTIEIITAEVKFFTAQTVQNYIEIGKRLIEAKEKLPHGMWSIWLKDNVEFSRITASRFMKIAEECSNVSSMKHLSYSKMAIVLQLPESERDDFMSQPHEVNGQEKTVADMTKRELQAVIKEKEEERRARLAAEGALQEAKKREGELRRESQLSRDNYNAVLSTVKERDNAIMQIRKEAMKREQQLATSIERSVTEKVSNEFKLMREENEELQRRLEEHAANPGGNSLSQVEMVLPEERTELAGVNFCDALENAFAIFEAVAQMSQAYALSEAVGECIASCQSMVARLHRLRSAVDEGESNT